jgi:hypothetical protein
MVDQSEKTHPVKEHLFERVQLGTTVSICTRYLLSSPEMNRRWTRGAILIGSKHLRTRCELWA